MNYYFRVKINSTDYLVTADNKTTAIELALSEYDTANVDVPNLDTSNLSIQCTFISDTLIQATV